MIQNPYGSEEKTLAEIWRRGFDDHASKLAYNDRYTSEMAMLAYARGWHDYARSTLN